MSRTPPQARCSSHTSSARSRRYGIQPIWPSLYASLSSGKRTRTPENRKSLIDDIALPKLSVAWTAGGASGEADGIWEDEPMCMQTTVVVSWQAVKNGSHAPVWMLGRPRYGG